MLFLMVENEQNNLDENLSRLSNLEAASFRRFLTILKNAIFYAEIN